MFSQVKCDEVEDLKGSETSMKGFGIKASISDMISLRGGKTVGVKVFLAGGCKEEVRSFSI